MEPEQPPPKRRFVALLRWQWVACHHYFLVLRQAWIDTGVRVPPEHGVYELDVVPYVTDDEGVWSWLLVPLLGHLQQNGEKVDGKWGFREGTLPLQPSAWPALPFTETIQAVRTLVQALRITDVYDAPLMRPAILQKLREKLLRCTLEETRLLFTATLTPPPRGVFFLEAKERRYRVTRIADHVGAWSHLEISNSDFPRPGQPVACGPACTFVLSYQGLFAFGDNTYGQLGLPRTDSLFYDAPTRVPVLDVIQVACAERFTAVLCEPGNLFIYGRPPFDVEDNSGRLRFRGTDAGSEEDERVLMVACSGRHLVALTPSGLYSVGEDRGMGLDRNAVFAPRRIQFGGALDQIAGLVAGTGCTFVLMLDGTVWACGTWLLTGLAVDPDATTLTRLTHCLETDGQTLRPMPPVRAISPSDHYTMFGTTEGIMFCGHPPLAQAVLLRPKRWIDTSPKKEQMKQFGSIAAMGHTAIMVGSSDEDPLNFINTIGPVLLEGMGNMRDVMQVYAGRSHCVAMTRDYTLFVAGVNALGQLGLGDNRPRPVFQPLLIELVKPFVREDPPVLEENPREQKRTKTDSDGTLGRCAQCGTEGEKGGALGVEPLLKRYWFCGQQCYKEYHDAEALLKTK